MVDEGDDFVRFARVLQRQAKWELLYDSNLAAGFSKKEAKVITRRHHRHNMRTALPRFREKLRFISQQKDAVVAGLYRDKSKVFASDSAVS